MYELPKATHTAARLTGLVVAMSGAPADAALDESAAIVYAADVHYRRANLSVPVEIISYQGSNMPYGQDQQARMQALHELFEWIDALPPVPDVSLDAMDRGELY